jgi:hypothetical protein
VGRKKSSNAFSLFSFQDIITSVTAILILIMLLLAVDLTQKRQSKAAVDPGATRRKLEKCAEELEAAAAQMREQIAAAQRADVIFQTRNQLERQLKQATDRLDQATLQRDDALGTFRAAKRARVDAEATLASRADQRNQVRELTASVAENRCDADRLEKANAIERERQARRKQEIEYRPKSGTQLVFNRPADSSRRPWLVELSSEGVVGLMLGTNTRDVFGPSAVVNGLLDAWIARLHPVGDYCLLLMRPSAEPTLLDDVESKLEKAGIQYGIDFIGEDQVVRDGSAEAAAAGR